jgi:hypothetical protein
VVDARLFRFLGRGGRGLLRWRWRRCCTLGCVYLASGGVRRKCATPDAHSGAHAVNIT